MNILYVVPDLRKVSGGPRTRISMFKNVFNKNNDLVIEKGNKFYSSLKPRKINVVYVESATNRIGIIDLICLLFLRLYSKEVIVYIRDIYIELFPENYSNFRSKITLILNKMSNFFLTLISTSMVFPTNEMGTVFFNKNTCYPRRKYTNLPPGTVTNKNTNFVPNFDQKLGLLYLGSTKYDNSGFDKFIEFSEKYSSHYNFHVLSGDSDLKAELQGTKITLDSVKHDAISTYLKNNNIAFAIHTRPRNTYDDLTFPIKVLDFISLRLPFFSEKHLPLIDLLGAKYSLYQEIVNYDSIHETITNIDEKKYLELKCLLKTLTLKNTYEERYKKLLRK